MAVISRTGALRTLLLAAFVVTTATVHARIATQDGTDGDALWVPQPELARVASIGFQSVVSDYHWLQAVQVVGASIADPSRSAPLLGRLVDVVTTLDPWVDHPYRFAAIWMTDSPESVRKADAMLTRGIEHHPDEWRNHFYQGFNRFFYLEENEAAAESMERAAGLPGSPRYLPQLVARLRAGGDGLEVSAAMLAELAANAEDPYEKAEYEKALDEIETERIARSLDAAREEFRRRRGRDISRVEDLAQGPDPVLPATPPEIHGWEWVIDPASGRIVSSWYGVRYEPLLHAAVREERERQRGVKLVPYTEAQ